jgi:membrane-associated phospholipid phosphatase
MMIPWVKNKAWQPFATYSVMYFETALLTTGITNLTKSLSQRTRPYYYNQAFNPTEKQALGNEYGEHDSFFSGHAAIAFSSAVFLSTTYTQIYGKNSWSKIIWASSIAIATGTTYLRYESGQHFPTDLIAGAAIGASIGYFVPFFHKVNNEKLGLIIAPNQFHFSYRF